MSDLSPLYTGLLEGNAADAAAATQNALDQGVSPVALIEQVINPAMSEVGRRFEEGEYFVPELLMAARATKAVFELLRPRLAEGPSTGAGRIVLGTVQGDLHDIGKNLVAAMLESAGLEVIDLGVNVPPEKFLTAVEAHSPQLVGLSALLTSTMPAMKSTLDLMRAKGVRDRVKVIVGGAPVTQAFADSIGADGYGETATFATELARRLLRN